MTLLALNTLSTPGYLFNGSFVPDRPMWLYERGTQVPVQTFSDSGGTTPQSQPILTSEGDNKLLGYVDPTLGPFDLVDALTGKRWAVYFQSGVATAARDEAGISFPVGGGGGGSSQSAFLSLPSATSGAVMPFTALTAQWDTIGLTFLDLIAGAFSLPLGKYTVAFGVESTPNWNSISTAVGGNGTSDLVSSTVAVQALTSVGGVETVAVGNDKFTASGDIGSSGSLSVDLTFEGHEDASSLFALTPPVGAVVYCVVSFSGRATAGGWTTYAPPSADLANVGCYILKHA